MEWSKTAPTTSGYYWIKTDADHQEIVRIEADAAPEETEWDPVPIVYAEGASGNMEMDQFIKDRGNRLRWYGPLTPPE